MALLNIQYSSALLTGFTINVNVAAQTVLYMLLMLRSVVVLKEENTFKKIKLATNFGLNYLKNICKLVVVKLLLKYHNITGNSQRLHRTIIKQFLDGEFNHRI